MTTRAKILGGFIFVSIFGLILGITGMVSTSRLTTLSDEQYQLQQAGASISGVLNAHNSWKQQLTETVLLGAEFKGSLDPATCAFGKWKNTDEAKSITDPAVLKLLTEIEEPHSYIHIRAKDIVALVNAGDMDEAGLLLAQDIFPQLDKTVSLLTEVESDYNILMEAKGAEIVHFGNLMTTITIALIVVTLVACVLLAWKITSSTMKPIQKITQAAQAISTGDLDVEVEYAVNDEIGQLAKAFRNIVDGTRMQISASEALADGNLTVEIIPRSEKDAMGFSLKKTADSLDSMLGEIATSTVQVSNGAKQMADSSQMLAQGSTEQASVVEQLSASINEISEKTSQNANRAKEAAELSAIIKINTEKGSRQMGSMMQAVRDINDASSSISKVIKVIDDIAFQTNILALNAAVEAARAGQHGKGFAVVAEEVRNLAQKSAEAAKDTGGLIESSIERANLGLGIAAETSDSLKEIVDSINRSAEIVTQITRSSDEQVGAIMQINSGIEQVAQVVQQNNATAEEIAATSEEMSGQADLLQGFVSRFKLQNSTKAGDVSSTSPLQGMPDTAFALHVRSSMNH